MRARDARRLVAVSVVAAWCGAGLACKAGHPRITLARLTFEPVSVQSQALGDALTPGELARIEQVALDELRLAFDGLRVAFVRGSEARYRVTVTQRVRDPRMRADMAVAGASRAVTGLGGSGVVNFSLLASAALSCAPTDATRLEKIDAIGRGVGRAVAHEFAHQFLPRAPIHDSRDVRSYEYHAASRCEQYFGPMHWDLAGPLLRKRLRW